MVDLEAQGQFVPDDTARAELGHKQAAVQAEIEDPAFTEVPAQNAKVEGTMTGVAWGFTTLGTVVSPGSRSNHSSEGKSEISIGLRNGKLRISSLCFLSG